MQDIIINQLSRTCYTSEEGAIWRQDKVSGGGGGVGGGGGLPRHPWPRHWVALKFVRFSMIRANLITFL